MQKCGIGILQCQWKVKWNGKMFIHIGMLNVTKWCICMHCSVNFSFDFILQNAFLSRICKWSKIQNQGFSRISLQHLFSTILEKSLDSNAHICYIGWKDQTYYPIVPKQDSIPKNWSRGVSNRKINWCDIVTVSKSLPADKLKRVDDNSIDDGMMIMAKQKLQAIMMTTWKLKVILILKKMK